MQVPGLQLHCWPRDSWYRVERTQGTLPEAGLQNKGSLNREDGVTDNTMDILEELRSSNNDHTSENIK